MKNNSFFQKLRHNWVKLRLKPIRVFCFHQVSEVFEPETMKECDWVQTEAFKRVVLSLKEKYTFVSLQEAYKHIANDKFRLKHYAVLTADDGWASIQSVLPWLAEQNLPVTLFLNPLYLDGKHFREWEAERYLSKNDLDGICDAYPDVSFGMHGWEHVDVSKQIENEFKMNVVRSIRALEVYGAFVPFFAYPWGRHKSMNDRVLKDFKLVPVLMDGERNFNDSAIVHRELLTD